MSRHGRRDRAGSDSEPDRKSARAADGAGPDADPQEVARTIALRLLDVRPRTRHELTTALARRRVPEDAAEAVLDRLTEVGLIDDAAFATAWVDSRHVGRGLGRRALAQELHRKGIDGELAEQALAEITSDDEEAVARDMVERKLRSMDRLDDAAKQRRLFGLLARKGIPAGTAQRVIRDALSASASHR